MSGTVRINPALSVCNAIVGCIEGTIQALVKTDGAVKVAKLAVRIFNAFTVAGYDKLINAFTWVSGIGQTLDIFRRLHTLLDGKPKDWAATASAVCFVAYRFLGTLTFLQAVKLFNFQQIVTAIGKVPYIGTIALVPFEVVGGFGALFDTVHHSKRLHSGIQAEVDEYQLAFECTKIKQDLIIAGNKLDDDDSKALWTTYEEHSRKYIQLRIDQGKEPAVSEAEFAARLASQTVRVMLFNSPGDDKKAYVLAKVAFEKRKFEVLHKNALDNMSSKYWLSGFAIAANLAKIVFVCATLAAAIWSIALLAASTPLMLALGFLAGGLGVAKVIFEVNTQKPEPKFLTPKIVGDTERKLVNYFKQAGIPKESVIEDANENKKAFKKQKEADIDAAVLQYARESLEIVC